jgi:hypothetical protein
MPENIKFDDSTISCKLKLLLFNLPINDPHWLAGTIKRIGICVSPPEVLTSLNCEHHCGREKKVIGWL